MVYPVPYHILSLGQPSTVGTTDIPTDEATETGGADGSMFMELLVWRQSLNSQLQYEEHRSH